ncbi:MAG: hypothetical protein U0K66_00470 [Paludibacteraceae bacterium]|nr:hypothetical protein [Paludibacteraceae bacterium]
MKGITVLILLLSAFFVLKAKEPSNHYVGMLIYLDQLSEVDKINKTIFDEILKKNYTIKEIYPQNPSAITLGFRFYIIKDEKWNGVIAVDEECGVYKLKGFNRNDFSTFFSDFKYLLRLGGRKMSNKKLIKNLEQLQIGVDFKCLYEANKRLEYSHKEKYPCAYRDWNVVFTDHCFEK